MEEKEEEEEEEPTPPQETPSAPPSPSVVADAVPDPSNFFNPEYKGTMGGRDKKIEEALDAVKSELTAKGQELTKEKAWAEMVKKMMDSYNGKLHNVNGHINKLRDEMK